MDNSVYSGVYAYTLRFNLSDLLFSAFCFIIIVNIFLVGVPYCAEVLQGVADRTSYPEYQEELKAEQLLRERLDMLPIALEWLKEKYPNDYELINAYYFSERKINMVYLAEKYGLTHQALSKKMSKARQRLKEFITLYEKQ